MGERYRNAAAACLDCCATPEAFLTHSTKDLSPGKLMVLSDIIFAGGGEFARQWCLFNRQEEYDPRQPGEHSLSMSYGGAAGHSGVLSIGISEGELSPDFSGRKWEVTVGPYGEEPSETDTGGKGPNARPPTRTQTAGATRIRRFGRTGTKSQGTRATEGVEQRRERQRQQSDLGSQEA